MNSSLEAEFLSQVATKYKLNIDKLWKNYKDLQQISTTYNIPYQELINLWQDVENKIKNYEEYDESIEFEPQQTFNEQQHTYNDSEITLAKFGLADLQIENVYSMRKLKLLEGETKFFLRQLINSYNFLKYHEKLNITHNEFNIVYANLKNMTFSIKKSPLGLLLAIYIYDKNTIINMDKFYKITKVKKGNPIDANLIIPINYIYKVYASDLVRYTKLYHKIL